MKTLEIGTKVRFTRGPLGASERDDLGHYVPDEVVRAGDLGIVAFPHPNQTACPEWVFVAVDALHGAERQLYVAAHPEMFEVQDGGPR